MLLLLSLSCETLCNPLHHKLRGMAFPLLLGRKEPNMGTEEDRKGFGVAYDWGFARVAG